MMQDFQRKSALFSLASSEILIINLWEHQVGLYQGANMGLLKTVFEANLSLFGKKSEERYMALLTHALLVAHAFVAQTNVPFFSSLSVTITALRQLRICKRP